MDLTSCKSSYSFICLCTLNEENDAFLSVFGLKFVFGPGGKIFNHTILDHLKFLNEIRIMDKMQTVRVTFIDSIPKINRQNKKVNKAAPTEIP